MEALGLNLGYLLVYIGSFIILFIILAGWVYRPVLGLLEKRRMTIAQGLEDARIAAEARANAEKEAAAVIGEAQARANSVVSEAAEKADKAALEVKAVADTEIVKQREAALADAYQERERILGEVRGQVVAISIAAAQKLIGEALDEKRQHALLDEFFSGVKAGKVVVLEGAAISGASADVTSALPLTDAEKSVVRRDVLNKLGEQASVNFHVDPSILGGLVIKAGGKVLDASVAGQLDSLRQSLA
ncbi:MAG: F0F1 ATP synthase subunit B [Chloroflexota bacterium]